MRRFHTEIHNVQMQSEWSEFSCNILTIHSHSYSGNTLDAPAGKMTKQVELSYCGPLYLTSYCGNYHFKHCKSKNIKQQLIEEIQQRIHRCQQSYQTIGPPLLLASSALILLQQHFLIISADRHMAVRGTLIVPILIAVSFFRFLLAPNKLRNRVM